MSNALADTAIPPKLKRKLQNVNADVPKLSETVSPRVSASNLTATSKRNVEAPPPSDKTQMVEVQKCVKNENTSEETAGDAYDRITKNLESSTSPTTAYSSEVASINSKRMQYEDQLSLVASNMKTALQDLKHHLLSLKKPKPDYSHVGPILEAAYKRTLSKTSDPIKTTKTEKVIKNAPKKESPKKAAGQRSKSPTKPSSLVKSPEGRGPAIALVELKNRAQDAIKHKKIFSCRGQWDIVRRSLTQRGWVEKIQIDFRSSLNLKRYMSYSISELHQLMRVDDLRAICERVILSKMINKQPLNFYWVSKYENVDDSTMINKFKREVFSYANKGGLCVGSKQEYWWRFTDVSGINHPRTYRLSPNTDLPSFIKDYRLTAAMSLLKWVIEMHETKNQKIISPSGKISTTHFNFAVMETYKYIKTKMHDDIDTTIIEATDHEWRGFLEAFYKIMYIGNHFKSDGTTEIEMVKKCGYLIKLSQDYCPYMEMDGTMNLWILKPMNSSMGIGIMLCRDINFILNMIKKESKRQYIVQKYIERPFLIHNTKFDIRQYFLISSASPLTIWMYKTCYLRFCSQTYNLNNLHEAIHLTNNSVQKKYMRPIYDPVLPNYLMWDSDQFQKYLSNIGFPDVFQRIIYPEMKKCFTAAVLMLQDKIDKRPNCFELYGADFMVTEDFKAWLIEINSNPALFNSTPVTRDLCPKVIEDVIKVMIDHTRNPKKSTGNFEEIYKQKEKHFLKTTVNLKLKGKPAPKEFFEEPEFGLEPAVDTPNSKQEVCTRHDDIQGARESLSAFGSGLKETLESLQQLIRLEKSKVPLKTESTSTVVQEKSVQGTFCNIYQEFYDQNYKDGYVSPTDDLSGNIKHLLDKDITNTLVGLLNIIKNEKAKICQKEEAENDE